MKLLNLFTGQYYPKKLNQFFLIACLVLAIFLAYLSLSGKKMDVESETINAINELNQFLTNPLEEIDISSRAGVGKHFYYKINSKGEIKGFLDAAVKVNCIPTSGHSGPIYESILSLRTTKGEKKYFASVHKYDKNDLFLTEIDKKIPLIMLRLPGLGSWIIEKAPEGLLKKE